MSNILAVMYQRAGLVTAAPCWSMAMLAKRMGWASYDKTAAILLVSVR